MLRTSQTLSAVVGTSAGIVLHAHQDWVACPNVTAIHFLNVATIIWRVLWWYGCTNLRWTWYSVIIIWNRDPKRIANALSASSGACSLSIMTINSVCCVSSCKLVVWYWLTGVIRISTLVWTAMILLPLVGNGLRMVLRLLWIGNRCWLRVVLRLHRSSSYKLYR
jgi:hypothetical protein